MTAPRTPTKGRMKQHMADAPFRERGPSTAFMLQEPEGPGWSFSEKQFLTLARRSSFLCGPDVHNSLILALTPQCCCACPSTKTGAACSNSTLSIGRFHSQLSRLTARLSVSAVRRLVWKLSKSMMGQNPVAVKQMPWHQESAVKSVDERACAVLPTRAPQPEPTNADDDGIDRLVKILAADQAATLVVSLVIAAPRRQAQGSGHFFLDRLGGMATY